MKAETVLEGLDALFPDARCELNHRNSFELAVAVILSAQTTDASVNRVTPGLFEKYPDAASLASADIHEIERCIASLGLYRNKARAIQGMAKALLEKYHGEIPSARKDLESLPGVGRKCANVILSECFGIPALAVDTHVSRVSRRLGLARPDDSLITVEAKLKRKIPRDRWIHAHHQMIFFGRYLCHSRNPECGRCPFADQCRAPEKKKEKKTASGK